MVRNVVKNALALSVNGSLRVVFGMVIQVLIARALGATALGKFAVMTAYIAIFQVIMQLGLPNLTVREVARHREEASRYWWSVGSVLLLAGAAAWGLQVGVATLWGHPPDTYAMVVIAGLSLVPFGLVITTEATLRGLERMEVLPAVQMVAYSVYTFGVLATVIWRLPLVTLGWAMVMLQTTGALLYVGYMLARGLIGRPQVDVGLIRRLLRQAPHFYGLPLAAIVPNRVGIIIIAKILGEEASGIFNAAQLLARALFFVSTGYSEALYPALSRLFVAGWDRFRASARAAVYYGLVLSATLSLAMMAWAPWLVAVVFGRAEYAAAVPLLRILCWEAVLFVLNGVLGVIEMAANRQDVTFYIAVVKTVTYMLVIALAAYVGGLTGAAVGTLLSGAFSVALHLWMVHRIARGVPTLRQWVRPLAVIAVGIAAVVLTRHASFWVYSLAPLVVYALGLFAGGVVRREDIQTLIGHLSRRTGVATP